MSGDALLTVSCLAKKYAQDLRRGLAYALRDIARELVPGSGPAADLASGEFWAVRDLSFELARGEALAIVGTNGAGKSTLLKIIYGILKPDRGEARVRGRVEALLELNTAFNPLLTGRENVRVAAALLGLNGRETDRLLEEVVDFSELEEFIDLPLQSYSSGMKARLGYSLSALLKPDLLLVDEILAVGDVAFQHKCIRHMQRYLRDGGSLLLVSHSVHQIQTVCARGILLSHGRMSFAGTAIDALNAMFEERSASVAAGSAPATRSGPVSITALLAQPAGGNGARPGEPLEIVLRYAAEERVDAVWGISIWTADQWICITSAWNQQGATLAPGEGELRCVIPNLPLVGGRYLLRAAILERTTFYPVALFGHHDQGLVLEVRAEPDRFANLQMHKNELVKLDVEWG
ncbi:MAG TPA: ABC transporter ATP-binding protein [Allosphingosinicella sp.]|nr:ABC transporter ATP-binding protein [Allosphingosinicella sp.]